jgi:hypothetical protein
MNLMKRFFIFLFIALLMIANVNFYRYSDISLSPKHSLSPYRVQTEFKSQQSELFSFIDRQNNFQVSFDRFQKNSFKISLSKWHIDNVLTFNKVIISEVGYYLFSSLIILRLDKPDIIFPFQYFW